jgi:CD63 antigen
LFQFAILLCLIFILEIAGGVAGYIMKDDVYDMLETRMNSTLKSYNSSDIVKKTWNIVQHDVRFAASNFKLMIFPFK